VDHFGLNASFDPSDTSRMQLSLRESSLRPSIAKYSRAAGRADTQSRRPPVEIVSKAVEPAVFLIDDDPAILRALRRVLETAGHYVREWTSPAEFLREHDPSAPGCLVTDLAMPDMNGMELLAALHTVVPERIVICITGLGDIPTAVRAMKAGALSFLPKPVRSEELLSTVAEALAKDAVTRAMHQERMAIAARIRSLTPRECEVLRLVASGLRNKQIAAQLGAAEKTIKVQRGRLMEKMSVRSAAALVNVLKLAPELVDSREPAGIDSVREPAVI
jgi:FixJ family two-component response regulator